MQITLKLEENLILYSEANQLSFSELRWLQWRYCEALCHSSVYLGQIQVIVQMLIV